MALSQVYVHFTVDLTLFFQFPKDTVFKFTNWNEFIEEAVQLVSKIMTFTFMELHIRMMEIYLNPIPSVMRHLGKPA